MKYRMPEEGQNEPSKAEPLKQLLQKDAGMIPHSDDARVLSQQWLGARRAAGCHHCEEK